MLGIEASLGRAFLPGEDQTPGEHPVVMLGHGFWQRAFGGDPGVLGSSVRLAGQPFTVIGVTPEGFQGLTASVLAADFFVPLVMYGTASGLNDHGHFQRRLERRYMVVARTPEGETPEGTRARLDVVYRRIKAANPGIEQEWSFSVVPFTDVALDPESDRALQPFVVLLLSAGGLVLLLAGTNLATFLLARGARRKKEIALRLALGAGRGNLVGQLFAEAALLALLGGAAGLLLAQWTLGLLAGYQPPLPVSLTLDLGLDGRVLTFTFAVTAVAALISGLAPALRSSKPDLAPSLKGGRDTGGRRRLGFNNALVAAQMAMSVVLLVGGGLFVRSLAAANRADLGFSVRDAGIAYLDLSVSGVPPAEYGLVTQELLERVRGLPGIESATAASHIPFLFGASGGFYDIPGVESPGEGAGNNVRRAEVDPAFFETLGVPLVMGRGFSVDDRPGTPRVAVVNETAARLFWAGQSPIGRVFSRVGSQREIEVVGVVGDTKMDGLGDPPRPFFYFPLAQALDPDLIVVARGQPAPEAITVLLRDAIREVDPDLVVMDLKTMEENIGVVLFPVRVAALLLGTFGVLALALASVGLYGVVSYSASRRTQEMGIRVSLGADAGVVRTMVVGGALRLVALGGAVGLAVALALAQLMRPALFGIDPWDPATVLGVPLLLGLVATAAAAIPALRASRVSPVEALRYE
jgi:predicted permease